MRVALERVEGGSQLLTVSELGEDEASQLKSDPELLVVGFDFDGDAYLRVFPADTPHLPHVADNLQRLAPAILRQASLGEPPAWENAVDLVLERLASTEVEWMFIGGVAVVAQGAEVMPADVDLITNVAGAKVMNDVFADCLVTPAAPIPEWGYFGRAFHGARIEWAGNDPGDNPQMWNLGAPQRVVSWRGQEVRVALLETYDRIERHRGRQDRVDAIERALAAAGQLSDR